MNLARDNFRRKHSLELSESVRNLERRFEKGEEYCILQAELNLLIEKFIDSCYQFKVGDVIVDEKKNEIEEIDYSIDYCFNRIEHVLIVDYPYFGYEKGLFKIELLELINDSQTFHNELESNSIFQDFYGYNDKQEPIYFEYETENYLTVKFDRRKNRIAYYAKGITKAGSYINYKKVGYYDFNGSKNTGKQDLYFLKDEKGSIKIGVAKDVIKRIADLESAMNQHIDIIRVINKGG